MEFTECKHGVKTNKSNTVKIIENILNSNLIKLSLFTTKVPVVSRNFLENEDCMKVVSESGHRAYIRTELFEYADNISKQLYISTEYPEAPLLFGLNGNTCVIVAPLRTDSVEMYL